MTKIYENILLFGCMCSTAIFLRKNGFRSFSSIFDWVDSDLFINIELVENGFKDLLRKEDLSQPFGNFPNVITNTKYNFSFPHWFDIKKTFEGQIVQLSSEVQHKIERFYSTLRNGSCLLVYYSRFKEDQERILDSSELIDSFCRKYGCDFLFIFNFEVRKPFKYPFFVIEQNNVHNPYGGPVSFPFEPEEQIVSYLNERFSAEQKAHNLAHSKSKKRKYLFGRIINKLHSLRKNKLFV